MNTEEEYATGISAMRAELADAGILESQDPMLRVLRDIIAKFTGAQEVQLEYRIDGYSVDVWIEREEEE